MPDERDPTEPLYSISVAARLSRLAVPTLRLYERHGLVEPARTDGGTRRYSDSDVDRLRRIGMLVEEGVNLSAVAMLLRLELANEQLEERVSTLRDRNSRLKEDIAELRRERREPERDGWAGAGNA